MKACKKKQIPSVAHSTYNISEDHYRGDFSVPNGVNVTYTCVTGYHLLDPFYRFVGCNPPQKNEQGDVTLVARWSDTDGIVCAKGELAEIQSQLTRRWEF